jgi:hypothetical protein
MKVWAAYEITLHGEPIFPDFVFRAKGRIIDYLERHHQLDDYIIRRLDLDMPKYGKSQRELKREELTQGNIKEVLIVFRHKDGTLERLKGKQAIDSIKSLEQK